jgi:uncharacterized RDD family membrane protein YckC
VEFEDRITIATPEGIDLELTLAGVGSRFVAAILDTSLQTLVVLALYAALVVGAGGIGTSVYLVGAFAVWFGYHVLFEVLASGRTPGKRWTGLRVVREGGHPVTFVPSATRNLLRLVDLLPAAYVAGCVSILVTRRNQRLGDLAAGTLVIRDRRAGDREHAAPARAAYGLARPAAGDETAAWDVAAVSAEELTAVRRFLDRRHDLEPGARHHLAWQLADRLRPKTGGVPDGLGAERFLELLARAKASRV